jgi:acetyl-CoA C-acetyltransferase
VASDLDPRTPVIVGAGQITQRPTEGEHRSPVELAIEALRRAAEDTGTGDVLLRRADSVRSIATCWAYSNEAELVAQSVGATPRETVRSPALGGDAPVRMIGDAARSIASGEADVALISGAEALASLQAHQHAGAHPDWPPQLEGKPTRLVGTDRPASGEPESAVGLVAPLHVYALLESAVRSRLGVSRDEHRGNIASLWSRFSAVAAENPYAWIPRFHSPQQIAEPTDSNRAVSDPYTKLMTSNLQVDLGAAVIVCSAEAARGAGVARDRWVFPLASAFAQEEWFFSERAELSRSPAIRAAARAVLEHAGVTIDEVAHIELYSCFPSAVQIAATELGVGLDRQLTVGGGTTFAGAPANNFSTHGVATLVGLLREEPEAIGLCSALGWYCTKHAYGLYSATAPKRAFREIDANPLVEAPPARGASADHHGPATLEAYTIPYARDGAPEAVVISAIAADGTRVLARDEAPDTIAAILDEDPLHETVGVAPGAIDLNVYR